MKILDELPRHGNGNEEIFDWDTLLDGQVRLFEKGIDFDCLTSSMRGSIYAAARRRNLKVTLRIIGDNVAFQALLP